MSPAEDGSQRERPNSGSRRQQVTFVHTHRVRYHETDAQSFLFNSRYLEIADVAMTEFFRHLGWSYEKLNADGVDPSVVSAQLQFLAPADDAASGQVNAQWTDCQFAIGAWDLAARILGRIFPIRGIFGAAQQGTHSSQ